MYYNPKKILELLKNIDKEVVHKINSIKNPSDFRLELLQDEKSNSVGIIASLIEKNDFKEALEKMSLIRDLLSEATTFMI